MANKKSEQIAMEELLKKIMYDDVQREELKQHMIDSLKEFLVAKAKKSYHNQNPHVLIDRSLESGQVIEYTKGYELYTDVDDNIDKSNAIEVEGEVIDDDADNKRKVKAVENMINEVNGQVKYIEMYERDANANFSGNNERLFDDIQNSLLIHSNDENAVANKAYQEAVLENIEYISKASLEVDSGVTDKVLKDLAKTVKSFKIIPKGSLINYSNEIISFNSKIDNPELKRKVRGPLTFAMEEDGTLKDFDYIDAKADAINSSIYDSDSYSSNATKEKQISYINRTANQLKLNNMLELAYQGKFEEFAKNMHKSELIDTIEFGIAAFEDYEKEKNNYFVNRLKTIPNDLGTGKRELLDAIKEYNTKDGFLNIPLKYNEKDVTAKEFFQDLKGIIERDEIATLGIQKAVKTVEKQPLEKGNDEGNNTPPPQEPEENQKENDDKKPIIIAPVFQIRPIITEIKLGDKIKNIYKNIQKSKNIDKHKDGDNYTYNYGNENDNKKGEPEESGEQGQPGDDGSKGQPGGDNQPIVDPEPPIVEPVTYVEPTQKPDKPQPDEPIETEPTEPTEPVIPPEETQQEPKVVHNDDHSINNSNNTTIVEDNHIEIHGDVNIVNGDINTDNSTNTTNIDNSQKTENIINGDVDVRRYAIFIDSENPSEPVDFKNEDEITEQYKEEIMEAILSKKDEIMKYMSKESHEELIEKLLEGRNLELYKHRIATLIAAGANKEEATLDLLQLKDDMEYGNATDLDEEEKNIVEQSDIEIESIPDLNEEKSIDLCAKYDFLNSAVIEKENKKIEVIIRRSTELELKITNMKDPKTIDQLNRIDKQRGIVRDAEYEVVEDNQPKLIDGNEQLKLASSQEPEKNNNEEMSI